MKQGVWDITSARERRDVIKDAQRINKKVHFARIFPICSEKGSELAEGDPDRKFKGRCVIQGNDVKDENSHAAIFQELSSSPATLPNQLMLTGLLREMKLNSVTPNKLTSRRSWGVLRLGLVSRRYSGPTHGLTLRILSVC